MLELIPRRSPTALPAVLLTVSALLAAPVSAQEPSRRVDDPGGDTGASARRHARNVILFIGDGLDDHQVTLARSYLYGLGGSFSFDEFPHRAATRVQTVSEEDGDTPVYVGDSASGGTALAAGVVTSRGRISTTARTDRDVPTILELARRAGRRTGIVTTSALTDATPASFLAHTSVRFCQGPEDMDGSSAGLPGCPRDRRSAGGAGSIAEQIAMAGVDVLLGGGTRIFSQRGEDGEILVEQMTRHGYRLVTDAESLAALAPRPSRRVLGLFGPSTLPVEWAGEDGRSARPLVVGADGPEFPEPFSCVPNPGFGRRPTLEAMTRAAIEFLGNLAGSDGFFLMVESASIDKQAHAANPCGQIGETLALSDAVAVAAEFADRRGDTLVLVASDHGHSAQIVPYPSLFAAYAPNAGVDLYPPGKLALLKPPAGGVLAVSYGTNARYLEEHTGVAVPLYGLGPGAERVRGLLDQREVFDIMVAAFGDLE